MRPTWPPYWPSPHCLQIVVTLLVQNAAFATVTSESYAQCQEQCVERNIAFPLPSNELEWPESTLQACDFNCHVTSCNIGCSDLDVANSVCHTRCPNTSYPLSCFQGCRAVTDLFTNQIQLLLNHVNVESTLDQTQGVKVNWFFDETNSVRLQEVSAANLKWFTQSKKDEEGWRWTSMGVQAFRDSALSAAVYLPIELVARDFGLRLVGLWRDLAIVSPDFRHSLFLPPSDQPLLPRLVSSLQMADRSWALCWHSEKQSASESSDSVKFRLTLSHADADNSEPIAVIEKSGQCHLFQDLPKENCCTVTVEEVAKEGSAPKLTVPLVLRAADKVEDGDAAEPFILFTNGTFLFRLRDWNDYLLGEEPDVVPFLIGEDVTVTAVASLSVSEVLLGTSDGAVHLVDLRGENLTTIQKRLREPDGIGVVQISVDPVQEAFYVVREQAGITRCFLPDCRDYTNLATSSLSYIQNVAVDAWNGFLYYTTNSGDAFSTPLFAIDAPREYKLQITKRIPEFPQVYTLDVDYEHQKLLAILRNGTFMSMSMVDRKVANEREKLEMNDVYKEVVRSALVGDRLFWTSTKCEAESAPCLFSEERNPDADAALHLNRYLFNGKVVDFAVMRTLRKPFSLSPVDQVGLVLTDQQGKVSWRSPSSMPFQAPFTHGSFWRRLTYDCNVTQVSDKVVVEAKSGIEINTFQFSAEPGKAYEAAVRACAKGGTCSAWTTIRNTAFAENETVSMVVLAKQVDKLGVFDLVGEERMAWWARPEALTAGQLAAHDSFAGSVYTFAAAEAAVYRAEAGAPAPRRLLDATRLRFMVTLPRLALLVVASAYQVSAYRLNGAFHRALYAAHAAGDEVCGLAADEPRAQLLFLLQKADGAVELFRVRLGAEEAQDAQLAASVPSFPRLRQMAILAQRFVFITEDNLLGVCDLNLNNCNLNYDLKDVQYLLSYEPWSTDQPVPARASFRFPNNIEFGGADRYELTWATEPPLPPRHALYKVALFAKNADARPVVGYTVGTQYRIPADVLDKWNSKQEFDVQVSVITAWTEADNTRADLTAPTKPPNAPTNLRIFATTQKTVDGPRAVIDLFWAEPDEWNGDMLGYVVNCTNEVDGQPEQGVSEAVGARHSRAFSLEVKSGKVRCAVAARNEQNIVGKFSDVVEIDSGEFKPLVRLFAIDSTDQLLSITDWSTLGAQAAEGARRKRDPDPVRYQSVAFVGNELYAVRKEQETSQPFLALVDINDVGNVLHKIPIAGDFSQVSAMTSDWLANRLLIVGAHDLMEIQLENFENLVVVTPRKLFQLSVGAQDAKQLIADPFTNTAYLLSKNGSLFSLDLQRQTELNIGLSIDCLRAQTVTSVVGEFVWNKPASPLIYALTWNGLLTIDPISRKCADINIDWTKFGEKGLKSVTGFTLADKNTVIFVTAAQLFIYHRATNSMTSVPIVNPPLKQVLAASQASQPYPDRSCFVLSSSETIKFNVVNEGRSGAVVSIVDPVRPTTCHGVSYPPTQYEINFCRKDSEKVKHVSTIQSVTHVDNGVLDKETDYDVSVSAYNRYYPPSGVSENRHLRTSYGFPTAPLEPKAFALTPDTVVVYWKLPATLNAPPPEIKYRISQKTKTTLPVVVGAKPFVNGDYGQLNDIVSCQLNPCQAKISNLRPSTVYEFYVTAVHVNKLNTQLPEDSEAVSVETQVKTKDVPGTLRAENATSTSLLLRFNSLEPLYSPDDVFLQYRQSGVDASWLDVPNSTFDLAANPVTNLSISELRACTTYDYRFVAEYADRLDYDGAARNFTERFFQQSQQARTKPGTPSAPNELSITQVRDEFVLRWKAPEDDGGSPITRYALDFRKNSTSEWEIAEVKNQPDFLQWRVLPTLVPEPKLAEFRVRAGNDEGLGQYALLRAVMEPAAQPVEATSVWFWPLFVLTALMMLALVLFMSGFVYYHHKSEKAKKRRERINKQINLQNIGEIQFPSTAAQIPPEIQNEIRNLPKIPYGSMKILQELGKGSFGVVSKGFLSNWDKYGSKGTFVAIKQMKGCCKDQSRSHFLKEAILMNNFDHPNIIKLLGVCLDNPNDHMLVMEFMEGGDLNIFLRDNRDAHQLRASMAPDLDLGDLICMIVDVGRGCAHLEMHRYVHRDLATRNCLISSADRPRTTKISDFGMAREIHASEYYRLHGHDMLPLRWLSPEAAADGVFTSKSDVWAFGILMWEVITMAERPFRNWSNTKVLYELKNGKHPSKPSNCPDEIYSIMERCWIVDVQKRPTFADVLEELELLRSQHQLFSLSPYPSDLTRGKTTTQIKKCLQYDTHINNGFDDSSDSMHSRFNQSGGGGGRGAYNGPYHNGNSRYLAEPDEAAHYRPLTGISAETRSTCLDYEVPRASAQSSAEPGLPFASVSHSRNVSGYERDSFGYRNDGYKTDTPSDFGSQDALSHSQISASRLSARRPLPYMADKVAGSMSTVQSNGRDSSDCYSRAGGARVSRV